MPAHIVGFQPAHSCELPAHVAPRPDRHHERALACHLRAFLDDEDSGLLHFVGERVVQPVPLRPALPKHAGGVRALVVGDLLRRLVGKVLAQSFAPQLGQDGETLRTSTMFALSHIVVMPDDNPGNCALRMRTCLWEASACYRLQHIEHPVVRHTSRAALAGRGGALVDSFLSTRLRCEAGARVALNFASRRHEP